MADGIFMDRISGGLANRKRRAALRRRLSRNYRIVTDRRKGQSVFGGLRATRRTPRRAVSTTQFHHDCTNKKIRPVNCITSTGVALRYFVSGELTGGTFTPIGGSHAPRRCLSSEAAAR
jgi:phytoene dehydrogenase-like protein